MNVVYSASDMYSSLAGISLTSLLINNRDVESIHVIIMDNGISEENKSKLTATVEKYGRNITFVPLTNALKDIKINIQKWNISTFGRLFEASSLPDLDKVIHIDCDTVIDGSISPLWEMDMSKAVLAGAPDCLSDVYKSNIGMKLEDTYVNAGILVMNLARIRRLSLESKFLRYIEEKSNLLTYVDQEVLNACVPEDEKIAIPLRYNSYSILHHLNYNELKTLRHVQHMFPKAEYEDAVQQPIVIHYTGCFLEGTRPWIRGDHHPLKSVFIKYKRESQWADMAEWEDKRSVKEKVIFGAARVTPKFILAPIIGYVHGVYIPAMNKRLQEKQHG